MTSQKQISLFTEDQLTSLQVDSPASLTHQQESDLAKRMRDTSGLRCLEQFERFSRPGLWAKTFAGLLIGMEGWYSTKCRLSWKLKATKSHRFYFQLVPLTPRIEETEFGLWLSTPRANEIPRSQEFGKGRTMSPSEYAKKTSLLLKTPTAMDGQVTSGKANPVSGNSGTLAQEIMSEYPPTMKKLSMLPTPTCFDATNASNTMKSTQVKEGSMHSVTLTRAMSMGMLPTPNQRDYKGCTKPGERTSITGKTQKYGETLPDTIKKISGQNSQLSPQFVMEMMGFPTDWTLLPFLNGDKSQLKQEETQ